jgi:glycosyltransferase involved in cell wall biosynthesis
MRIVLCVTSDIATDQRVNRIALTLKKISSDIRIVGTKFPGSLPPPSNGVKFHRIRMLFLKGPMFYAEFNIRLFFFLLFSPNQIIVSNDLDTLPASFLVSRIKRIPLVYDSHEYFTGLPELVNRKWVRGIWKGMEKLMMPHIRFAYTVSQSIAKEYHDQYGIPMVVIRNLPYRKDIQEVESTRKNREKRILYQGALNAGRGLEMAIRAMQYVPNAKLFIAGSGYLEKELRELTRYLKLHDKVRFLGRIPPVKLIRYTADADLGISLEENMGLNYYYCLPNKLFDYIQAQIPVLVSNLPEMAAIVQEYQIGSIIETYDCQVLADKLIAMLSDEKQRMIWRKNLEMASKILCWENEETRLLSIFEQVLDDLHHR